MQDKNLFLVQSILFFQIGIRLYKAWILRGKIFIFVRGRGRDHGRVRGRDHGHEMIHFWSERRGQHPPGQTGPGVGEPLLLGQPPHPDQFP